MKWKEYQELAFQTNADLGTPQHNRVHMMLGIGTEIGELQDVFKKNLAYGKEIDWKNVKEEIGDILWYVAGFIEHEHLVVDVEGILLAPVESLVMKLTTLDENIIVSLGLSIHLSQLLVAIDVEQTILKIEHILTSLLMFCNQNDFDIRRIMENNIEKLRERYPDKFTEHDALNRNLEAETEVLDE